MIVETRSGKIKGQEESGVRVFRGIPFAAPPVGALRFSAPQREASWTGVRTATAFGPSAPQGPMMLPMQGLKVDSKSEDCLSLNIYTPGLDAGRRPVLVWIHGGGFTMGAGSQAIYGGEPLASRGDVVVVTLNYRLGPLGFLYLNELFPDHEELAANPGIRDQVAALEWVREHISAFGGDPSNVTLFGESAGGMSIGTLLATPAAKGLFQKAILQSGAAHNASPRDLASEIAKRVLAGLDLVGKNALAQLREMPVEDLLGVEREALMRLSVRQGGLAYQPVIDGDFLPEPPIEAIRRGAAREIPVIVGTTLEEWNLFGLLDPKLKQLDHERLKARMAVRMTEAEADQLIGAYRALPDTDSNRSAGDLFIEMQTDHIFRMPAIRLAEAQSEQGVATYMYRFDESSAAMGGRMGACHAIDVPFVFGQLEMEGVSLFAGEGPKALALSARVMDAWLAFARTGDPSHDDLPEGRWPAYESAARSTQVFASEDSQLSDPERDRREAWEKIL